METLIREYLVGKRNEPTRMDWIERALADIPAGSRILDAGAGEQQFRKFCTHLHYVSQDFAKYDGAGDGAGLQTQTWDQTRLDLVSDITSIPAPDGSFEAILCTEVFEHIPNPLAALREFSRLLCHKGRLILTVPFCSITHFAPYHFATGLSRYWFQHHLPEAGFAIRSIDHNGNYFEYIAQELRRLRGVAARYARIELSDTQRDAISTVLTTLEQLSDADGGSHELLTFGFHVIAERH
jgi:ubiquinone/menaquinone biosynthesis C-methylase UbiE